MTCSGGNVVRTATAVDLVFGSNSILRGIAEELVVTRSRELETLALPLPPTTKVLMVISNVLTGFVAVDADAGTSAGEKAEGYGKIRLLQLPRDEVVIICTGSPGAM